MKSLTFFLQTKLSVVYFRFFYCHCYESNAIKLENPTAFALFIKTPFFLLISPFQVIQENLLTQVKTIKLSIRVLVKSSKSLELKFSREL